MKIILDTDGTLTDFNRFIKRNAVKYFKKKYHLKVIYPNKLEIEDILDIKNVLMNEKNYSEQQAEAEMKRMLDKYWVSLRFVKFSLMTRFRAGAKKTINALIKQGHDIQIHTTRAKTCDQGIIGKIARKFTIWQYWVNGILLSKRKFYFYPNDGCKVEGVIAQNPQIVFEDKKEIIDVFNKYGIPTICIAGQHNHDVLETKTTSKIAEFDIEAVNSGMSKLLGKKLAYYNREAKSNSCFNKFSRLSMFVLFKFVPIILNEQNIKHVSDEGIIYAPNHRSTLDPVVITGILRQNIHWAALLRFFKGEDSIFNNSKNPLLCKITAEWFRRMEYFPIDRKSDNPNANNFAVIKDMSNFLKIHSRIGIFPEGTIKRPEGCEFGTFDDAFLLLAKKNNAWVQPITTLWIKELGIESKVIINFGEAFKVGNMNLEEALQHFMEVQWKLLNENKQKCDELSNELYGSESY